MHILKTDERTERRSVWRTGGRTDGLAEKLKIYESFNETFNPTNNYFIEKTKLEDKYEGLSDDELEDEYDELKRLGDEYEHKEIIDEYEAIISTEN